MIITFNTDNNVQGGDAFIAPLRAILHQKFEKYMHKISKIKVHLTDENGSKKGVDDKRCLLEAHIDSMEPIVCMNVAATYEESLSGAIQHLKTSLNKKLEKLEDHNHTR